jgi:hypothetical protein
MYWYVSLSVTALASMDLSCIAHTRWLTLWIVWFQLRKHQQRIFLCNNIWALSMARCSLFPISTLFLSQYKCISSETFSDFWYFYEAQTFQSFRISVKRATFQINILVELNCLLRCQPAGLSFWPYTSLVDFLPGFTFWRDTIAYGNSSPLTSLKELVFGKW